MLAFPAIGVWRPGQILITWKENSRPIVSEVQQQIERAWRTAMARPGIQLFDGPMCRLEALHILQNGSMHLTLSPTSYKPFFGTNLSNARFADKYGSKVLANAIGLSCLLISSDGHVLLGKRNANVAYYPSRIHPFAGSLEPAEELDIFDDVFRELREELALGRNDIAEIVCTGIAEDQSLRQPEIIFAARAARMTRQQIESQLDPDEHKGVWSCPTSPHLLEQALKTELTSFTPVAVAAIVLWGRIAFGEEWFHANRR